MFEYARNFEGGDLTSWDTSQVTYSFSMFSDAHKFNGNISTWSMGKVWRMGNMFKNAISFNGDISSWDVSGVKTSFGGMSKLFYGATAFD